MKLDVVEDTPRMEKKGEKGGRGGNMVDTRQPGEDMLEELDLLV